jgi:hypothetical protein
MEAKDGEAKDSEEKLAKGGDAEAKRGRPDLGFACEAKEAKSTTQGRMSPRQMGLNLNINTVAKGGIVADLEEFFNSNQKLTSHIGDFFAESAGKLIIQDLDEEQSLENHQIYLRYCEIIENGLDEFLSERKVTTDVFVDACREAREAGDTSTASLDYLLASTEYTTFLRLAQDFVQLHSWSEDAGIDGALEGSLEG